MFTENSKSKTRPCGLLLDAQFWRNEAERLSEGEIVAPAAWD
jgi:hypothetical protein